MTAERAKDGALSTGANNSQERLPGWADQQVLRFMHAAIDDGAHRKVPGARNLNIAGTYIYTQASLQEIGKIYRIERERVRQIVRDVVGHLWKNSSSKTQKAYPLETLPLRKPETLRIRRHRSSAKGGRSVKVEQALKEGKSLAQIREELGLSTQQIGRARKRLRVWGVEAPTFVRTAAENRRLAGRLRESQDDGEIQELLDQVNIGFLARDRQSKDPCLSAVSRVARDTSFHFRHDKATNLFVGSLRRAGVPVGELPYVVKSGPQKGELHYFFIVVQHKQRAIEVLRANPNLQEYLENPVKQICGPNAEVPSTTRLMRGGNFGRPGRVLLELGVNPRKLKDFLTQDCPVPVFRHRRSHYYPTDCQDKLRAFFRRRLKELSER